jgi:hypothetical protein
MLMDTYRVSMNLHRPGMVMAMKTVIQDVRGESGAFAARAFARMANGTDPNSSDINSLCFPSEGVIDCLVTVAQQEQGKAHDITLIFGCHYG